MQPTTSSNQNLKVFTLAAAAVVLSGGVAWYLKDFQNARFVKPLSLMTGLSIGVIILYIAKRILIEPTDQPSLQPSQFSSRFSNLNY